MKKWSFQKAFTLTEILVSLSITSVLSMMIGFFMTNQSKQADFLAYRFHMQQIFDRVEQAVLSRSVLTYSASLNNPDLFNCIYENSVDPCTATNPEEQVGLFLYELPVEMKKEIKEDLDAGDTPSISSTDLTPFRITGDQESPANFDYRTGRVCQEGSLSCEFRVRAFFWATCQARDDYLDTVDADSSQSDLHLRFRLDDPTLPSECDVAKSIHIRFQVKHEPEGETTLPFLIASIPTNDVFGDYSASDGNLTGGALTTIVKSIPPPTLRTYDCKKNEVLLSIEDGVPNCECQFPFSLNANDLCQIEEGGRCEDGERYRGNDSTGKRICQKVYCEEVEITKGCGKGGWIEGIRNNFWSEYVREYLGASDTNFNYGPSLNACAVMTDLCRIQNPDDSCDVEVLCNQSVLCCYETEPEKTDVDGADPYFGKLVQSPNILDVLLPQHKTFLEGGQNASDGTGGYEGTICLSDTDCSKETDYDPLHKIKYSLLCCPSAGTTEKRCRRAVYDSSFFYDELTPHCPTTCHDLMDPNYMDPNSFAWAKDYCSSLATIVGEEDADSANTGEAFIIPDDPQEYQCFSKLNPFLRISHEECLGWGYHWDGATDQDDDQFVGCCDNRCISNFNEFEDEGTNDEALDKVCNFDDNCDDVYNPDQSNLDWDDFGDACEDCPEDAYLIDYVGPCLCIECPYSSTDVDTIIEPAVDELESLDCDEHLCYEEEFYLYHYAPKFESWGKSDSNDKGFWPLYGVQLFSDIDPLPSTHGKEFFTLMDKGVVDYCSSNSTALGCDELSNLPSEQGVFTFVRKTPPENLVLTMDEIYGEQNYKSIQQEKFVDTGDLLDLTFKGPSGGNTDLDTAIRLPTLQFMSTSANSPPLLFATEIEPTLQVALRIAILPTTSSDEPKAGDKDSSNRYLKYGSSSGIGGLCAGPFALKYAGPDSMFSVKGSDYGKFDSSELWIHHGKDVTNEGGGDLIKKLGIITAGYGGARNPVNEVYFSENLDDADSYAYMFWACKKDS